MTPSALRQELSADAQARTGALLTRFYPTLRIPGFFDDSPDFAGR